jgi:hypothetical protein
MPDWGMLGAAAAKARFVAFKMKRATDAGAQEEARLAEARRLDADEVGRRADARRAEREGAPKG